VELKKDKSIMSLFLIKEFHESDLPDMVRRDLIIDKKIFFLFLNVFVVRESN